MIKNLYSETYSELLNMFYGIHVSLIQNPGTYENLSVRPEPFCTINLPIPNKSDSAECSILECFDLYSYPEILEGENSWFNEKTNAKQSVYKSIKFWSLPNILIVDLKRFNNSNKKVNILAKTLMFFRLIRCDLFLLDFLDKILTSKFLFKPSGVDFMSILSQKKLPS